MLLTCVIHGSPKRRNLMTLSYGFEFPCRMSRMDSAQSDVTKARVYLLQMACCTYSYFVRVAMVVRKACYWQRRFALYFVPGHQAAKYGLRNTRLWNCLRQIETIRSTFHVNTTTEL